MDTKFSFVRILGDRRRPLAGSWIAAWIILTGFAFWLIALPLRDLAVVLLLCGSHAYFSDGVHISHEHPEGILSNGIRIGAAIDQGTYFGAGLVCAIATYAMLIGLRRVAHFK